MFGTLTNEISKQFAQPFALDVRIKENVFTGECIATTQIELTTGDHELVYGTGTTPADSLLSLAKYLKTREV